MRQDELQECPECHWKYPDVGYLSQMFIGGHGTKPGYTAEICGLCALEVGNRELGINRKRFSGRMAEEMRQDAFHWRKKHPEHKPNVTNS